MADCDRFALQAPRRQARKGHRRSFQYRRPRYSPGTHVRYTRSQLILILGQRTPRSCFLLINLVKTQLDVDKQTLAFTINDSEFVLPFTGVRGPVIPAISVGNTTVCRITIENCHHW
jgi:hypothetical protein